jgi:glutathione peroxidase
MQRREFLAMCAAATLAGGSAAAQTRARGKTGMTAYDFEFNAIEGPKLPMANFRGKVVLLVNTASFCGFTPQYRDLEAVYEKYKDRGLVVLGVPSNDFGDQEPGTAKEIKAFCDTYDVTFPLTQKQTVVGRAAHPLYRWISAELGERFAPAWNFHKYLIGRQGLIAGTWPSEIVPTGRAITDAIEAALKQPAA